MKLVQALREVYLLTTLFDVDMEDIRRVVRRALRDVDGERRPQPDNVIDDSIPEPIDGGGEMPDPYREVDGREEAYEPPWPVPMDPRSVMRRRLFCEQDGSYVTPTDALVEAEQSMIDAAVRWRTCHLYGDDDSDWLHTLFVATSRYVEERHKATQGG